MRKSKKTPTRRRAAKTKATAAKRVKGRVIDPVDLVIQEVAAGIQLWFNGHPILLPNGDPLTHPRRTLVEHMREEFSGFGSVTLDTSGRVLKPVMISSYALLGLQRCMESDPDHCFVTGFGKWLLLDPCLSTCTGPERVDQMARWLPLDRYFEANRVKPPDFGQIPVEVEETDNVDSILRKRVEPLRGLDNPEAEDLIQYSKAFVDAVEGAFRRLGPEEWVAMHYLFMCHHAVLFPLLLVTGNCTAQEYANGLMAAHLLLTIFAISDKAHAAQSRGFREDAQVVLQFLEHARCPWAKEILKGEDETREFKATLRYDLATRQLNKELEHSVLKNVAGFLNSEGGTIFVGVGDGGEIGGIELDGFANNDKWQLHLVTRIAQQIGKRFLPMCSIEFDVLHGKAVAQITVHPSAEPAYLDERALKLKGENKAFFIRGGPSAQKLNPEETVPYLAIRFPSSSTSSPKS